VSAGPGRPEGGGPGARRGGVRAPDRHLPRLRLDLRRGCPLPPRSPRPLRFAHRGASARAPENTLAAFREAVRLGADVVECDVRLSGDGVPIILHDDTVDRTTDGKGAAARLGLAELKRLDAGAWFASRFRGERIPTLDETLEFTRGRCALNLEVKAADRGRRAGGADARATAVAVARTLRRSRFRDYLVLSSFSPETLAALRAVLPGARIGLLASRSLRGLRSLHRRLGLHALHAHVRLANRRRVRAARDLGLRVFFWTANDAALMRRLLLLGCDGLMTDDPALFEEVPGLAPRRIVPRR
jgi:glycerophosphoryl diester phosphodiesterase